MIEILLTSSALILAIAGMRRLFRGRISLRLQYALWLLAALRLLIPGSLFQSPVSVMAGVETVAQQVDALRQDTADASNALTTEPGAASADSSTTGSVPPVLSLSDGEDALSAAAPSTSAAAAIPAREPLFTWREAAQWVWYAGMIVMAIWFLFANLDFRRDLKYGAVPAAVPGAPLPVYVTGVPSPCLYGLFRPAIYVTRDCLSDEQKLRHVIAHEATHHRHGDQFWSLVRCACLVVWWFNPLVWLAANLSRRDCELACDEGALKRLGDGSALPTAAPSSAWRLGPALPEFCFRPLPPCLAVKRL